MSRLERALVRLAGDLNALGARWALIGGLAVSVRAEPRTTRDVDVAIAVASEREAEDLVRGLRARGYRLLPFHFERRDDRLATVRMIAPGEGDEGVVVDLLFGSAGIEEEIVAAAEVLELSPGAVPVAAVGHLLALKVLAENDNRPFDRSDIRALLKVAGPQDVELARRSLELMERRGHGRGKHLLARFDSFLAST
ncbi:MAG: hypothetical protein D6696_08370 [Acidobacteria bacterium]|nr:MAG: hypothetical protein D6696_08370 [Acidobacteriota bacterium]